ALFVLNNGKLCHNKNVLCLMILIPGDLCILRSFEYRLADKIKPYYKKRDGLVNKR
ncbi:MAG: hypothetical protein ACI96W_002625, partial [Paraglaciecola sp.]